MIELRKRLSGYAGTVALSYDFTELLRQIIPHDTLHTEHHRENDRNHLHCSNALLPTYILALQYGWSVPKVFHRRRKYKWQ
jgi:hypothetical protein